MIATLLTASPPRCSARHPRRPGRNPAAERLGADEGLGDDLRLRPRRPARSRSSPSRPSGWATRATASSKGPSSSGSTRSAGPRRRRRCSSTRIRANPEGNWLHEFTSLSTGPFVATEEGTPRWSPAEPGVDFRPVPGAPKPAATPGARLRQMRAIAEEFKAEDDFGDRGRVSCPPAPDHPRRPLRQGRRRRPRTAPCSPSSRGPTPRSSSSSRPARGRTAPSGNTPAPRCRAGR